MRFHIGFSFRLRDLKKFLFPILIGILAYFGFGLLGFIQVNAQVNYDTKYTLNYNGFYEDENFTFGGDNSLAFVLYTILDYYRSNNTYYDLVISRCSTSSSSMCIYLINKNADITSNNTYGYVSKISGSNQWRNYFESYVSVSTSNQIPQNASYKYTLPTSSSYNPLTTNWYNSLKNCLANEPSSTLCTNGTSSAGFLSSYSYSDNIYLYFTNYITTDGSHYITNTSNFTFNDVVPFYYSSFDIYFRPSQSIIDNQSYYVKNFDFVSTNDSFSYEPNYKLYSYFDIVNGNTNSNVNFEPYNKLGKIFVGGVNKSDISSLNIDLNYNYFSYDYTHTLNYNFLYFGRVDNTTYYSYEQINCSGVNGLVSSSFDTTNNKTTTTIFPSGLTCSSDLSTFDKIYIYIEIIPNNSYDDTIYNLQYNTNYGYIKNINPSLTTSNSFFIYERFENLDPNFEILLSTQEESNSAYYMSDNNYIVFNSVNRNDNKIGSLSTNPIKYGIAYNTNAMLFNLPRYYGGLSNVDLFINYESILSIGSSSSFTYYDSSNNLTTDTIVNNKTQNIDSSNYNMGYYFGVVNSYIDGLSLSILSFSNLIQSFYNSMPVFLQTFIFVCFILMCFYFTYLLIRK